jgi:hypothetical protein
LEHIRLKQRVLVFAVGLFLVSFSLAGVLVLLAAGESRQLALWAALACAFLAMGSLAWLAEAKCPRCGDPFIGNTIPENDGPQAKLLARTCQFCGYPGPARAAEAG